MRTRALRTTTNSVIAVAALSGAAIAGATFQVDSFIIAGGGGRATSGSLVLDGTIGQPDAAIFNGANVELVGGFWGTIAGNCATDFNASGTTNLDDLQLLLFYFGTPSGSPADSDADGDTDLDDLQLLLFNFGQACP